MSDTDIVNHTDVNDDMNDDMNTVSGTTGAAGESSSDIEIIDGPRMAIC